LPKGWVKLCPPYGRARLPVNQRLHSEPENLKKVQTKKLMKI